MISHRIVFVFDPVRIVNNCRDEGRKTSREADWSQNNAPKEVHNLKKVISNFCLHYNAPMLGRSQFFILALQHLFLIHYFSTIPLQPKVIHHFALLKGDYLILLLAYFSRTSVLEGE